MQLADAKEYIGKVCSVRWQDRHGKEQSTVSKIYDAMYVPLYGGYVVTNTEDIRLDRIVNLCLASEATNETPVATPQTAAAR